MNRREIYTNCSWLEAIRDDNSYNFVAVAFTPWHAISIDALILYLSEKGINIHAAVIITAHPLTGYALDESFFTNKCSSYYYDSLDHGKHAGKIENSKELYIKDRIHIIANIYKNIFLPQLKQERLYYVTNNYAYMEIVRKLQEQVHKKVVIAYSEEGVASYMGTLPNPNYIKVNNLWAVKNYIRYQIFGNYVYRAIHPSISVKIFRQDIFGLHINRSVLPYYHRAIAAINKKKNPQIDRLVIKHSIVICTTAWDRKQIEEDEDLHVMELVCNYLHNIGIHILLKTHPRDTYWESKRELLHAQMLNTGAFPMECICEESRPMGIISFSSTILITAKVFWEIPTFCLSKLLNRERIGEQYKEEIQHFEKTFKHHTCFIKSVEELKVLHAHE